MFLFSLNFIALLYCVEYIYVCRDVKFMHLIEYYALGRILAAGSQ